ncbi:Phospholipase/carboxylesterase [Agrocybe pediades]|nr:Phospholipase/carboxylesterase [Agrocybe pediades]
MVAALKYLVVPAAVKQTATVIFIHGLGDSGLGWKPVADMFRRDPALAHVKWVLPHAPVGPVTANMGMSMPTWFDIYSFGFSGAEDKDGMIKSSGLINELIEQEIKDGIDPGRIVLAGFSQGGAMTLLTGLTSRHKISGLAVLSGWLPIRTHVKEILAPHVASLPIFWGHGSNDPLVKPMLAQMSKDFLTKECGISMAQPGDTKGLSFNMYSGVEHSTNNQELLDLSNFLKKVVPA